MRVETVERKLQVIMSLNILLITLDQFRGDCLSIAGHPIVKTPNLDRLAQQGVRFARHYSQASPCGPGRASLYTGMYQMNHRVVANGTPLDTSFDNVALVGRRAGYTPTLFGYTDQSIDPRDTVSADDPRLSSYEGVLPGFDCEIDLTGNYELWREWLRAKGFDVERDMRSLLSSEHERPADASVSTFLTDHLLEWIDRQDQGWFAHASFIRPHPPYSAAGEYGTMYDPAEVGEPIAVANDVHPFHQIMLALDATKAPTDLNELAHMRAQYFGMVSEVDAQLGRIWDALEASGQWENTVVFVTADHAELLGDHGLKEKVGYWETSQHIVSIIRDPRHSGAHGTVIDKFTENIDIMPTLCEALGLEVSAQCDGLPLTPFLEGNEPPLWRDSAHWEYDWRSSLIPVYPHGVPWKRHLETMNLSVRRSNEYAYVQFADGDWLCFDIDADPTWRTQVTDPAIVMREAQAMLQWRMRNSNRTHADFLVENGGTGRWPTDVPWRNANE
jgi:arylsulfatase A-like enzyme